MFGKTHFVEVLPGGAEAAPDGKSGSGAPPGSNWASQRRRGPNMAPIATGISAFFVQAAREFPRKTRGRGPQMTTCKFPTLNRRFFSLIVISFDLACRKPSFTIPVESGMTTRAGCILAPGLQDD